MKEAIKERINGYGILLRFITPMMLTIMLALLGWIRFDLNKVNTHFTNHLMHHADLEIAYERRLTGIESNRFTAKDGQALEIRTDAKLDRYKEDHDKMYPPRWLIDRVNNIKNKCDEVNDKCESRR